MFYTYSTDSIPSDFNFCHMQLCDYNVTDEKSVSTKHQSFLALRHVKTRTLLQICKQVVAGLLWSRYQDVFALLVPSCCDKSGTSCYHLLTKLMPITDLLQAVPTRLIQVVRNKLLRACCHQLVNNLLRADDIRRVGTTCRESLLYWPHQPCYNWW
jgi:hypothetical protein